MNRIDAKRLAEIREAAKDLPPFTITVTDPKEAALLVSALILHGCQGNIEDANRVSHGLGVLTKKLGIEAGVDLWFQSGIETGAKLPLFLKPVIIHYFTHIEGKMKKE